MNLDELQDRLGYRFKDTQLLEIALTHRSYRAVDPKTPEYDRLEFLGDAVLGLIVSEIFFEEPSLNAGDLTKRTSHVVSRQTCNQAAESLGLAEAIRIGPAAQIQGTAIQSDCMEAVIAAVYLDGGMDAAQAFVRAHFAPFFETASLGSTENPKAQLNEYCLKEWKQAPAYKVVETSGPDHAPSYKVVVSLNERVLGEGSGGSKRLAESRAAQIALEQLSSLGGKNSFDI